MKNNNSNLNLREELQKARKAVEGLERNGVPETIEAFWEVCCGDVLVAEENLLNPCREWENAALAKELLDIGGYLEGYDHILDNLYTAVSRMVQAVYDHPGLKLKLLEFELQVLRRIEAASGHELSVAEDVMEEISFYRRNIDLANNGEFDKIEQSEHLKNDPVEWSAEYESVIDEVNRKVEEILADHPRGMGFCFAYWRAKADVLREDYGIEWRSPAQMNPGVLFD